MSSIARISLEWRNVDGTDGKGGHMYLVARTSGMTDGQGGVIDGNPQYFIPGAWGYLQIDKGNGAGSLFGDTVDAYPTGVHESDRHTVDISDDLIAASGGLSLDAIWNNMEVFAAQIGAEQFPYSALELPLNSNSVPASLLSSLGLDVNNYLSGSLPALGFPGQKAFLGGSGDDMLTGFGDAVRMFGRGGNDHLIGATGNDTIDGGKGDDIITAGAGQDLAYGGYGNDTFIAHGAADGLDGGLYHGGGHVDGMGNSVADEIAASVDGIDTVDYSAVDFGNGEGIYAYLVNEDGEVQMRRNDMVAVSGGMDDLRSIEVVIGTAHDDMFALGSTPVTVEGGAGNDTYIVSDLSAADVIIFESPLAAGGIDDIENGVFSPDTTTGYWQGSGPGRQLVVDYGGANSYVVPHGIETLNHIALSDYYDGPGGPIPTPPHPGPAPWPAPGPWPGPAPDPGSDPGSDPEPGPVPGTPWVSPPGNPPGYPGDPTPTPGDRPPHDPNNPGPGGGLTPGNNPHDHGWPYEDIWNIIHALWDAMTAGSGVLVDPLVFDLSGTGFNLVSLNSSHAYFDLLGGPTSFAHSTGWTANGTDAGFLVQDAGADGKITSISELFGSGTQSGFAELAALDSNSSGTITSSDTDWSTLKMWIDENGNGRADSGELHTLGDLGITEIDLTTTASGADVNGNTIVDTANFVMGGNNYNAGEVLLAYSPTDTVYQGGLSSVDWDTLGLPSMHGFANVPDLLVAASLDSGLKTTALHLQDEASLATFDSFTADFKTFMYQWTGVQDVDPTSRNAESGYVANAQELAFMEHLTGISFLTPYGSGAPTFTSEWTHLHQAFSMAEAELATKFVVQSDAHLQQAAQYDISTDTVIVTTTDTAVLDAAAPTDTANATALYWAVLSQATTADWATKEYILGQLAATGGDLTGDQKDFFNMDIGTSGNDTNLDGADKYRPDFVLGGAGDDTNNSSTVNNTGTVFFGGDGNDSVHTGDGNDMIVGGADNDTMQGGYGYNAFVINAGDGQDTINGAVGVDTVLFTTGIASTDLSYARNLDDLIVTIGGGGDSLTVHDYFTTSDYGATHHQMLEHINFVDEPGTKLTSDDINAASAADITGSSGADTILGVTNVDNVIHSGDGNDLIAGGAGNDTLYGENGNDTIYGGGVSNTIGGGNDTLYGGAGDDYLESGPNSTTDFYGGTGDDTFYAGSGTDILHFADGDGHDFVTTSAAAVKIVFDDSVDPASVSYEKSSGNLVIHYGTGDDTITVNSFFTVEYENIYQFHQVDFSDSTVHDLAHIYTEALVHNGTSGNDTLYGLDSSLVEYVNTIYGLDGADNIYGGRGADSLYGGNGDDYIVGYAGNDVIDGGAGADAMFGGYGDDTYVADNASDYMYEYADQGTDTVQSSITWTLGTNFENLTLTGSSNINGTGNSLDNILTGNSGDNTLDGSSGTDTVSYAEAGSGVTVNLSTGTATGDGTDTLSNIENATGSDYADTLTGSTGNNVLDGGAGADTMIGGTGDDTYVVDNASDVVSENSSEGTDLVQTSLSYTLGSNVENLTLTGTSDLSGTGNSLVNVITGNSGNNVLDGSSGADTMIGGDGNDTYVVDDASDTISENANEGSDLVQSSVTYTLSSGVENLTLTGSSAIDGTGNSSDNVLTGNSGVNVLTGGAGNDTLDGGSGADSLSGGTGDDTYVVDNASDLVSENSSEGTDLVQSSVTYTLTSNVEDLTLTGSSAINGTGNSSDNVLTGNSGVNVLTGSGGNDTLDGGSGADTMIGGTGNDTYVVDNASDVVSENSSEGTDLVQSSVTYTLASDVENLALTGTSNINGTGNSAVNILTGNSGNNILDGGSGADSLIGGDGNDTYVVDNTGDVVSENPGEGTDLVQSSVTYTLASDVENLTLTGSSNLSGTGNSGDNVLTGNSGVNVLTGGAGNDTLDGGSGADSLIGGTGDDTYIVDNASDTITENSAEGWDLVQSSVSYTLASNVEALTLTGSSAINGTGNSGDNILTGNSGVNVLTGNGGNDLLDGGTGADTLIGGTGDDTYVVDNASDVVSENSSEGTDLVQSSITWTLGSNVENLALTGSSAINGTGNSSDNVLTGNSGVNVLTGSGGNDTLDGGTGADTLIGGTGNDTYVVDNASDVVSENSSEGTDLVQSSITWTLGSNVENLTLTGTAAISGTGNSIDNVITGNSGVNVLTGSGGNDTLDGHGGADTLIGGTGDDTYIVDSLGVTVSENSSEGTDTIESSLRTYTLGANVENLTLTGTSDIDGTGNSLDNVITGNSANNILIGGAGNDTLDGGDGTDTVSYAATGSSVVVNLSTGGATGDGTDTLSNIENVIGSAYADTLTGSTGANVLDGGAGADTMIGGTGNDSYFVDNASDVVSENSSEGTDAVLSSITYTLGSNVENLTLTGTSAIDGTGNSLDNVITGNSGVNNLTGGAGSDTLDGGTGADTMIGGTGNDTYVVDNASDVVSENSSEGTDLVLAKANFTLSANIENLTLFGPSDLSGTGNSMVNIITGNMGNNLLDGGSGADSLIGGAGNDTYVIDNASDTITENTSEGADLVQSSVTWTLGSYLENLTLTGSSAIDGTGNSLDNVITGNSGVNILTGSSGNDTLDGGTDADTLIGGTGNDTYVVDDAGDVVSENSSEGTDWVHSGITYTLGSDVENLMLTGSSNHDATGNSLANILLGNGGNNVLTGGGGSDTLDGGAGTDTLIGGTGDDTYVVDSTTDVISENSSEGTDVVQSSVNYTMASANVEVLMLTGSTNLHGTGDSSDNTIIGNTGSNVLDGAAGADTLIGGAGNDTYVVDNASDVISENAGEGTDLVQSSVTYTLSSHVENLTLTGSSAINGTGSSDDNVITGNIYANTLSGGDGNDTLDGGDSLDTLTGGNGADVFLFHAATAFYNIDVVTDFSTGQGDKLDIRNLLTGFDPFTDNVTDWVRISDSGGNSSVEVDRDGTGGGYGWTQMATLTGVTGLTDEAALVASGNLVVS
jgi:Ca2+-binding RTX toxin-like protein